MGSAKAMPDCPFDCVVPAAGASSRMGAWKPLLPWKGTTVAEAVVDAALEACGRVVLVTGFKSEILEGMFRDDSRVICVRNPSWDRGLFGSLLRGADAVRSEAFFVVHADMAGVRPEKFRAFAAARTSAGPGAGPRAFRPYVAGRPAHPVLLDRAAVGLMVAAGPDGSMRGVMESLDVRVLPSELSCADFDDPAAYRAALGGGERLLVVLTGNVGAGKTTAMRAAAEALRSRRLRCAGAFQVASGRAADGTASGYDLELVPPALDAVGSGVGESHPLARRPSAAGYARGERRPFEFNDAAFGRAAETLSGADCPVLLDEVGGLELEGKGGHAALLERLLASCPGPLAVSARPERAAEIAARGAGKGFAVAFLDLGRARPGAASVSLAEALRLGAGPA